MTAFKVSRNLNQRKLRVSAAVACLSMLCLTSANASPVLTRLQDLLNATPEGGWVKASTNLFSDAWATGSTAVQYPSYQNPGAVVMAWSSAAWDSARGDLLLWGGGHANYAGNEMYVWDGETGQWGRGSLSSRVDSNYFVVDNAAPQSAHTYDNNIYLAVNDMFLTFGGAIFQSGGNFTTSINGNVQRAGPWLWDPSKADPNKVGGTTGSGYDPSSIGGEMWINRQGQWTGTEPSSYGNATAAYRAENGKDVVYVTADTQGSGFQALYRYTLGDVKNGGADTWEKIGIMENSVAFKGAGTIDTKRNLYVRTADNTGSYTSELAVWDLSKANPTNPAANKDIPVQLIREDGSRFPMTGNFGIEYDSVNDQFLIWDGGDKGTVWTFRLAFDPNGNLVTTVVVKQLPSTTAAQPGGNFMNGVLGKWDFIYELGAFIAINEYSSITRDAEVWLYKPYASEIAPGGNGGGANLPEPNTVLLMCLAIGLLARIKRQTL
ncbi:MAG: hypothetical protein ACK4FE_05610 [Azonexus sp.]